MGEDDDGPWLAPEEAEPRFILTGPDRWEEGALQRAGRLLEATRPAALILDAAIVPADGRGEVLAGLRELAQAAGTALLLRDDPVAAINNGADGVHLDGAERVAAARRLLGPERLIGCACGLSRHRAMEAGEAGADYVLLGEPDGHSPPADTVELVAWWSGLFVLPCAAPAPPEPAAVAALVGAGVDFVLLGEGLWAGDGLSPTALAGLAAALARPASPP